ncbi:MAG: ABC transporter permease [Oscillospiraceae bacterium]|nr:ABC transporter permease [Oscillospiraceae bacterium]
MKGFVFITTIRRILKQPLNWIFLALFPVLAFILISISMSAGTQTDITKEINTSFGIVDNDNTVISKTLAKGLGLRYNIIEVEEADISAKLTEQEIPWILLIRKGYEDEVLTSSLITTLEGYSLTITDVSSFAGSATESITRSLMLLGTDDEEVLSQWASDSMIELRFPDINDNWSSIAQWLAMFGYISFFTAYFVIKTLLEDKKQGMPDRVGVLPVSSRSYLVQGTLAVFAVTEFTVALSLGVLGFLYGGVPNAVLLFLLMSLYNLFSVSFILAITSFAKDLGAISVIMVMSATLFAMLGGLFWPIELVPPFMRKVAWFSPGYWFAEGLKNIHDITFEGYIIPMLFLLGFSIITLLIGGLKKIQKMEE